MTEIQVSNCIDNMKIYLSKMLRKDIKTPDIANLLRVEHTTLLSMKMRNSKVFIYYLTIWCIKNKIDISNFVKIKEE
jgi:hypothetical protein